MMDLYHVTNSGFVESIMKEGLTPHMGENSSASFEPEPKIFLCDKESVVFWSIILGRDTVLRVRNAECHYNSLEDEYYTVHRIPPEKIEPVYNVYSEKEYTDMMKKVCMNYIGIISRLCKEYAEYYATDYSCRPDPYMLMCSTGAAATVIERLDFDVSEVCTYLKERSDNRECTYDDICQGTNHRLYQMLTRYPEDRLTFVRTRLYNAMARKLDGTFHVDTGKWRQTLQTAI